MNIIQFKLSVIILIIFVSDIFSQQKPNIEYVDDGFTYALSINSEPYIIEGEQKIINFYNFVDENKPGSPILPSKTFFIAVPPGSKINIELQQPKLDIITDVIPRSNPKVSLAIDSSLNYQETEIDPKYYTSESYPKKQFEIVGYTWIRDYYCAIVKINTHRYSWQKRYVEILKIAKLKIQFTDQKPFTLNASGQGDFDESLQNVILNFDQARFFRSYRPLIQNDSTGNWIDYSKEYIKLKISLDGIHRINYNDIIDYGLSPELIDPLTFKIYWKGKEIPLFVSGEGDHSFDPGDFIEFWATKNYGSPNYRTLVEEGEDYLEYLDRYTDTTFIWLAWDGENGSRTVVINNYVPNLTDTISSNVSKIHMEENILLWYYGNGEARVQLPFWQENKYWKWLQVTNTSNKQFNFDAESIVPNSPVYTLSRLSSWYVDTGIIFANAHKYGAKLNSTEIRDSVTFDFESQANLEAVFNSAELINGLNKYRIAGMPNDSASTNKALVDWVDIDYYRFNHAINDSIIINIPDSITTDLRIIKVDNITVDNSSLLVYKVNPIIKNFITFQLNNNILTFTDTVSGGDKYYIVSDSYLQSPFFIKKKQFVNLRDPSKQADYILISNNILEQSVSEYQNFIASNYGFNVQTAYVDDIYDEFGFGYLSPEPIQEFLKYAFNNWQSPKPSYLTIIGDATYDYKENFVDVPSPRKKIIVPSFGNPVSDVWFTTWDTSQVDIQQMFVGRIPANNNEEVHLYLDKHQTYINREFDEWNKKFLLFSGGNPNIISELNNIKQANDRVLNNIIKPSPVGGSGTHFYKTINPPTNFGPYTFEEINSALGEGGLFVSYIGHSGTRTWDNGITDVDDIQNSYSNRFPVVSDNGCSTGKFAEPDVDAFGELFINQDEQGQAISYFGNTSLGYTSTALRMPDIFYQQLVVNPDESIGETHFLAKMDNFNQSGFTTTNRLYNYTNTLLGDPVIKIKTPLKPNFVLNTDFINTLNPVLTDRDDSAAVELIIANFGRVVNDSLTIKITDTNSDSTLFTVLMRIPCPMFKDTLKLGIPILGIVGLHKLIVELDPDNLVEELSEVDNIANIEFLVSTTNLRPVEAEKFYSSRRNRITLLNPTIQSEENLTDIEFEYAVTDSFINPFVKIKKMDTLFTHVSLEGLFPQQRYYWRTRLNSDQVEWGSTFSFYNDMSYNWFFNHSFAPDDVLSESVVFNPVSNFWNLGRTNNELTIISAGANDGEFGSIQYNREEILPNTFYWGIVTAELDTSTLSPINIKYFIYPTSINENADSLISYIESLVEGEILILNIGIDAAQTVLGYGGGTPVRQAIETLGSVFIDSVRYRDSWCMIGVKGAETGSVPEAFSRRFEGTASIDTTKQLIATDGYIQLPKINNSAKWLKVFKSDSLVTGANLEYFVRGIRSNNTVDTLGSVSFQGDSADLSFIDANTYPQIDFLINFASNSSFESPTFKSLGVNFIPLPELGTNYQVVSSTADTVLIGEDIGLSFYIYNVGESTADSFRVNVDVINKDNTHTPIFSQMVETLGPENKQLFALTYNTSSGTGDKTFLIDIDSDKQIRELFEDNNFYSIPFFIKPDTSQPSLQISFDGGDILDGDYISPNPEIKIELTDETLLPITDSSAISILLNNAPVYYANNQSILSIEFNEQNPKAVVTYKPALEDGEYTLTVFGKNSFGSLVDSSGTDKRFLVSNELKLLDVYNYPNPTSGETHFTFKLTQIPEEVKIRIFTIAGRLIRELKVPGTDLNYDFNKIYWDGKDEDGDVIGNGVYLYKVILTAGEKTENVIQKLAIVR